LDYRRAASLVRGSTTSFHGLDPPAELPGRGCRFLIACAIRVSRHCGSDSIRCVMKDIVLVCLAIDADTGAIDPAAPFMVIAREPYRSRPYCDEPDVTAQFHPGERQARFEAVWAEGQWKFGRRLYDA